MAAPERTQQAHGVDALQALLVAIVGIDGTLSRGSHRLSWIGEPGDTGIPRLTPIAFGLAFRQRIERVIEGEIERHAEDGRRRHVDKAARGAVAAGQIERLFGALPDGNAPDLQPADAVLAHIGALAPSDLETIDQALIAAADTRLCKVAFLVAKAMTQLADCFPADPRRILRATRHPAGQARAARSPGRSRAHAVWRATVAASMTTRRSGRR